jgi:hypothetical protein
MTKKSFMIWDYFFDWCNLCKHLNNIKNAAALKRDTISTAGIEK